MEFSSSGRALMLRFRSDDNINSKGFSVAYDIRSFGSAPDGENDRYQTTDTDSDVLGLVSAGNIAVTHPDEPV